MSAWQSAALFFRTAQPFSRATKQNVYMIANCVTPAKHGETPPEISAHQTGHIPEGTFRGWLITSCLANFHWESFEKRERHPHL